MTNRELQEIFQDVEDRVQKTLSSSLGESMSISQTIETKFKELSGHFYLELNDYLYNDMERDIKESETGLRQHKIKENENGYRRKC